MEDILDMKTIYEDPNYPEAFCSAVSYMTSPNLNQNQLKEALQKDITLAHAKGKYGSVGIKFILFYSIYFFLTLYYFFY